MRRVGMVVSLIFLPAFLKAQRVGDPVYTVTGTVVDSVSGRAVDGADVYFGGSGDRAQTKSDGKFTVGGTLQDSVLSVRRIGFVPARIRMIYSHSMGAVDLRTIRLRQVATRLDEIAVEAEEVRLYPELSDFYRRKNSLPGHFVTPVDLSRVMRTSDPLRAIPSVEISCGYVGGCLAYGRRVVGLFTRKCPMAIYIDGLRHENMGIDDIPVETVAGIEVYSGPSTTPTYFGSSRCGTIVVWTRRG